MTKSEAKKELLRALADILDKDDDLIPDEVNVDEEREYRPWDAARNELSEELRRRAKGTVHRTIAASLKIR